MITEDGRMKLGGFSFATQVKVEGNFQNPDLSFDGQNMIIPDPAYTALEVLENKQK